MKNFILSISFLGLLAASCGNKPADANATTTATTPSTSTTTTAPAPVEATHSTVVSLNTCEPKTAEEGEDLGFYMMNTEDLIKKEASLNSYKAEAADKVEIKAQDGSVVKTIDAKALMGSNCAGFVVSKNGKQPEFYPLDAQTEATMAKITAYFK